jgi:uncharacterized protein YecE (DUF72 family)
VAGTRQKRGDIRIGISGWRYKGWRGRFYPDGLAQKNELAYAASAFSSIEINGTFYSLQRPELFARWFDDTPEDFVFALKGARFITHMKKLKDVKTPLANFFASGPLRLNQKLGPILWQLPPNFGFDAGRLESFFKLLPRDTEAASALARRHDDKLKGRAWLKIDRPRKLRHAIEIRHATFKTPEFIQLLRKWDVALVCADSVDWPLLMDVTSDFVYCRLHGSEQLYASGYDEAALDIWGRRVVAWAEGRDAEDGERVILTPAPKRSKRDVFIYFDNDAKVRAPVDAQNLRKKVDEAVKHKG